MQPNPSSFEANLAQSKKRASRYWFEDGLFELVMGGLFFLFGILFVVEEGLLQGSWGQRAIEIGLPLIIVGGVLAGQWGIRRLKERLTYPRTGYVSYFQKGVGRRWFVFVFAAVLAAAVIFLSARNDALVGLLSAFPGLIVTAIFLIEFDHPRHLFLAGIAALLSLGIVLARIDSFQFGYGIFFTGIGLAQVVSGFFGLRHYLQQTQLDPGTAA